MRKLFLRLLLLVMGVSVGLVLAEILVRLLRPQPVLLITPGLYIADPPQSYALKPGFSGTVSNRSEFTTRVRVNAAGLRGGEVAPAAPGKKRLLAIGDSFTFGIGVEEGETFVARTAARLAPLGLEVQALNGGVPGFGLPDEVSWFERHGEALGPDLVVIGVFLGNDLENASPTHPRPEVAGGLVAEAGSRHGLKEWLYYHSHLYTLVKGSMPSGAQMKLRKLFGMAEPWAQRVLREEIGFYTTEPSPPVAAAKQATGESLDRLLGWARPRRIPVVALLIPDAMQVDRERFAAVLHQLELDPKRYAADAPTRAFKEIFAARGVPVLDLSGPCAAALAHGDQLYFRSDRHWTTAGHELAAKLLAVYLTEQRLLPAAPG